MASVKINFYYCYKILFFPKTKKIVDPTDPNGQEIEAITIAHDLTNGNIKGYSLFMALAKGGLDEKLNEEVYGMGFASIKNIINTLVHEYGHAFDWYLFYQKSNDLKNWNVLTLDNKENYKKENLESYNWYMAIIKGNKYINTNNNSENQDNESTDSLVFGTNLRNFIKTKLKLQKQDDNFIDAIIFLLVRSYYAMQTINEATAEAFAKWYLESNKTWGWSLINEFFINEFQKFK